MALIPETFAAIAGQILVAEFTAYSSKSPNADIIAMIDTEEWLGGTELLEYVTISPVTYRVQIRCGGAWYDSETDDTDTISRVLSSAAKRIELAIAATLA